eukprot:5250275-Ditylum_brightwellii.AAC.1
MADEIQEHLSPPREPDELTGNNVTPDPPLRRSTRMRLMTKRGMESLQQSKLVFGAEYYDEQ